MDLNRFFPYRMAVLSEATSQCIAQVYRERFGLTRDEWRVLAALAGGVTRRMVEVAAQSTLEKMQVSRAAARMHEQGLLDKQPDPDDGRGWRLRLTGRGQALYEKIVPMVQAREAYLLSALSADEQAVLDRAVDKLIEQARQLNRQG